MVLVTIALPCSASVLDSADPTRDLRHGLGELSAATMVEPVDGVLLPVAARPAETPENGRPDRAPPPALSPARPLLFAETQPKPAPVSAEPVDPGPAPGWETDAWSADPLPPDGSGSGHRVFVHYSTQAEGAPEVAAAAARRLRVRGHPVADIRSVSHIIGAARVRYFFESDRAAAQRVAALLSQPSGTPVADAPFRLESFAHYRPLPRPGNIEVWIADRTRRPT